MPDKSTYDFLDAGGEPAGPALAGPDLNQEATRRSLGVPPTPNAPFAGDFITRNYRGVPIDLSMESPTALKTSILMREKPEDRFRLLEEKFGKGNVRLADDGTPIVTIAGEGNNAPVEFRPLGGGLNVTATALAALPETVGVLAGMKAGGKVPTSSRFLKFAAEMIGASLGQEAAGAAKDVAVSSTPFGQILEERAAKVPQTTAANVALGAGGTMAAKGLGKLISPFGGPATAIEKGSAEAVDYFARKYGINYPLTTGEQISSPLFKRVEATMSREPGASQRFSDIQRQKVDALRQIQAKMLGSRLDPTDIGMLSKLEEDVGEEAINAIRQSIHPIQRAEEIARSGTAQAANDAIIDELAQAAGPARQLYPERVGAKIRAGAFGKREAFENESARLYDAVYNLPGGTDKILSPPSLASDAKQLLKEQPTAATTVPSRLVGPSGEPLMSGETGQEVMKPFVPEGIRPMLETLAGTQGAKFSLRDLVKMRTEVRNNIRKGEAIPGTDTHYLGEIEDTLTKAINESTSALPTADLRTAWQRANSFYRDNVQQFKDKNIARLFKDKETGAFIQDEDLVRNIGPSEYQSYKKFFGENSDEFKSLKRSLVDSLLPGNDVIDAKDFLAKLYQFSGKNRSVAEDILGPQTTQRLERISGLLQKVQEGDVIDRDSIMNLLVSGQQNKLAGSLDQLVSAQRKLTATYKSQIIKDIADGKLGQHFDSTEFVNRLWDTASPQEIGAIKAQLSPEILDDLQRKVGERIFQQSQRKASGIDAARLEKGEPFRPGTASSIEQVFGSEQNKARLEALIGEDRMNDFEQLAKLLRGGQSAERAFAGAGGFSAQMQIHNMLRGGVFSYLSDWAKQKIGSFLYFSTPIRSMLANQVGRDPQAQAQAARALVLSQPFMSAMTEDFGNKTSTFIDKVLDSIDLYQTQGAPGKAAVQRQDWVQKFLDEAERTNPNRPRVLPINP